MRRNTLFSKTVGILTLYAFSSAISPHPAHAARGLAPISFNEMYSLAEDGEVEALRASIFRGLNIDTVNSDGDTGLCIAARRHDVYTYNSFRAAGANPRHPCTQKISDYEEFLDKSNVVGLDGTSREALSAMGNKETYKISSSVWWWLGGAALAGGILALVLSHHQGGGGGDSGGSSSGDDESYKSLGANAYSNGKSIRKTTGTEVNKTNLSYDNSALENLGDIDLQKNVLENTDKIKSILYAEKGGSYTNDIDTRLEVGVGTIGMNAVKTSSLYNDGYIKIDSINASVGMVASEESQAENHGFGIITEAAETNGINMNFSGYAENASIIGMYADTKSRIANYGDIYGKAIKSAQKDSSDDANNSVSPTADDDDDSEKPVKETSSIGTLIGMEAMILNTGSNLKNYTITVVNGEGGNIYLSAGDSGTTQSTINVELVGIGSYLDDAFLNGSNVLNRAEHVSIVNDGVINLNYSGNYSAASGTALRKGLGGVVGIRTDANSEAFNNGTIEIILHDEFQNDGVDVAAGMQSVHGGNLTNTNAINLYTSSENKRINYGMLAVEGSGTNSSLYANIDPTLENTADGTVNIQISNGYGMASFVGGKVINKGHIVVGNKETRFNSNIAMYGYGSTKKSQLENTGVIDLHSYNSIAMQNDFSGGTDISNDGIINVYESATDSYAFGGAYSNLYNNNTINYYATSSTQERTAGAGVTFNPFKNYSISVGTSIMSSKTRSIKEDAIDFKSSTTEAIYNSEDAVINMVGSSYVAGMSIETNDNAASTQAKAYNNGTINILDRDYYNATNAVGMYVDKGSLNSAGIYNNNIITTDSKFSAAMASNSMKNADVINNGEILAQKDCSLGIYISDVSNVINNNYIRVVGSNSVAMQAGGVPLGTSISDIYEYPSLINGKNGVIIVGNPSTPDAPIENSYGIFADEYSSYNGEDTYYHMAAQIKNDGIIEIFTKNAGAAILSLGDLSKIENNNEIDVFGDDAYGIYSGGKVTVINNLDAIINIGNKTQGKRYKNSYAIYNTGDGSITNTGIINLNNDGDAYAIYSTGYADIVNEGIINLLNTNATAIYALHGTVTNRSSLKLEYDYNTAIEISGDAKATNESGISIDIGDEDFHLANSVGIKVTNGEDAKVINRGTINLYNKNDSYAIWASGTADITNAKSGNIYSYYDNSTAILTTGTDSVNNAGNINVLGYNVYAIRGYGDNSILSVDNSGNITVGEDTLAIENDVGAAIYASAIGSVINSGSITVYNQNGYGIYATSGTKIENSGYIEVKRSDSVGIYAGTVSTVINSGTVKTNQVNSKGIAASDGSTAISNSGLINIVNGSNGYGIYTLGTSGVTNTSTITVGSSSSSTSENGNGIYAPNASGVNNSGRIEIYSSRGGAITGNGIISNSGYIGTYGTNNFGIYSSGSATVNNLGTVNVTDGYGISTLGSVTNGASGTIRTENGIAVKDAASLTNSGQVTANSSAAAVLGVKTITNNQDSSIVNTNTDGNAITNAETITNYGSITSKNTAIDNATTLTNYGAITGDSINATVVNVNGITNYDSGVIKNNHTQGYAIKNAHTVINNGTIESYDDAIHFDVSGSLNVENYGHINVKGAGDGHGIFAELSNIGSATILNKGYIDISGSGNGIRVKVPNNTIQVSITNEGVISSTSPGIYVYKNYHFEPIYDDQGKITGYNPDQDGTTVTGGSVVPVIACNGDICVLPKTTASTTAVDDPAEPVYADAFEGNSLIATNDPSILRSVRLVNRGVISTGGNVDFGTQSTDEAQISIGSGGSYQAESFTGTIRADADIVEEGFETTYVNEDSFVGENRGVEVVSQSYMFEASTQENEDGNTDVVMTMKPFEEVVDDAGISEYLSRNYQQQNSEQVFKTLKSAADKENFTSYLNKELGLDFIPNLTKQSLDTERNISAEINDDLLDLSDKEARNAVSLTMYENHAKSKGMTTGYKDRIIAVHGFSDRVVNDDLRAGLGLNVMRADSDYDNGSKRYNNTASMFVPVIFDKDYFTVLIKPKAGFSRGHYRRDGVNNIYKAKTKEYFYGADIAAGKDFAFDSFNIKPTVGMNFTELQAGKIKESNGGLIIKKESTLSAMSILGLEAAKKVGINDYSAVIFTAGAKYFHEFGDRYKNHAQLEDTTGYFQVDSNRFKRDLGLLKFKAEYNWKNMDIDAALLVPVESKQKPYYMLNAKYKF